MTASLVCDGPDCTHTETNPERAQQWWRVERQGPSIEEPTTTGREGVLPLLADFSVHFSEPYDQEIQHDQDEPVPMDVEDLPVVVLHFAELECLIGWASLASALTTPGDTE